MTLADKDPIRDLADRAIRDSLRFGEHLRGLLAQVVPDLVDGFDFTQVRPLDRDFPVEDWRRREADLPLEIPYRAGNELLRALVVVLLEHQSDTDPMMPLRLLYFAVVYWDQQWRAWEEAPAPKRPFRLNPVLPVVVYTGATPWGSNRTLADLLGEPAAFHAFAPQWQPLFWNLADQSPERLLASDNAWLQLMAVLRVEDAEAPRFQEVFTGALQQVKKIKGGEHVRWQALMQILLTWVFWRRPDAERPALLAEAERVQASVKRKGEIRQMTSKLGPSFVDLAWEKAAEAGRQAGLEAGLEAGRQEGLEAGRQEGLQAGRREGLQEGRREALREALVALLQDKFSRLPKKLQRQIEALQDVERLSQAIRRVPECSSLEEFEL